MIIAAPGTREDFLRPVLKSEAVHMLAAGATIGLIANLLPDAVNDALACDVVCKQVSDWIKREMAPIPKPKDSELKYSYFIGGESNRMYDFASDFWNALPKATTDVLVDYDEGRGRYPAFHFNLRTYLHNEFKGVMNPGVTNSIARATTMLFLLLPEFDDLDGITANHDLLLNLWHELEA